MGARPRIAFLGIGLMGAPQARRLLGAGFALTAWNRTRAKAEALADEGAAVADDPAAAVRFADVVVTMLERGTVVADVLFKSGAHEALREGALVIDMSSVRPDEARAHALRLKERGVRHLDAPVSGGTVGAEQGTLAIMVGGDEADFEEALPVFAPMGRATRVGPSGAGQVAKLANQIIVGGNIAVLGEALVFAARGGADPARVRDAIRGGFAESRILDLHGERMVRRDFTTRGRSTVHLKDMENALATGEAFGFRGDVTELVAALLREVVAQGDDPDHAAIMLAIESRQPKKT